MHSRIARVCKSDCIGDFYYSNIFSSFIKVRLGCYLPGNENFFFNYIESMVYVPEKKMFYAIFSTSNHLSVYSAICSFNLTYIDYLISNGHLYHSSMHGDVDYPMEQKYNLSAGYPNYYNCESTCVNDTLQVRTYNMSERIPNTYTHSILYHLIYNVSLTKPFDIYMEKFVAITFDYINNFLYVANNLGYVRQIPAYSKYSVIKNHWYVDTNIKDLYIKNDGMMSLLYVVTYERINLFNISMCNTMTHSALIAFDNSHYYITMGFGIFLSLLFVTVVLIFIISKCKNRSAHLISTKLVIADDDKILLTQGDIKKTLLRIPSNDDDQLDEESVLLKNTHNNLTLQQSDIMSNNISVDNTHQSVTSFINSPSNNTFVNTDMCATHDHLSCKDQKAEILMTGQDELVTYSCSPTQTCLIKNDYINNAESLAFFQEKAIHLKSEDVSSLQKLTTFKPKENENDIHKNNDMHKTQSINVYDAYDQDGYLIPLPVEQNMQQTIPPVSEYVPMNGKKCNDYINTTQLKELPCVPVDTQPRIVGYILKDNNPIYSEVKYESIDEALTTTDKHLAKDADITYQNVNASSLQTVNALTSQSKVSTNTSIQKKPSILSKPFKHAQIQKKPSIRRVTFTDEVEQINDKQSSSNNNIYCDIQNISTTFANHNSQQMNDQSIYVNSPSQGNVLTPKSLLADLDALLDNLNHIRSKQTINLNNTSTQKNSTENNNLQTNIIDYKSTQKNSTENKNVQHNHIQNNIIQHNNTINTSKYPPHLDHITVIIKPPTNNDLSD